ncbi:MAG: L-rhamnose isomerase [Chloroflexi bacterium]|nr:L-rhamnose isomerase [Chloroflexota bacterium]
MIMEHQEAYEQLAQALTARGIDVDQIKVALRAQRIETPSWGYSNSGTRFKVFGWPGAARNVYEKLADAAFVQSLTGIAPSVALHIPWDMVDDWSALSEYAASLGMQIGAINPNVFQDEAYKFGSFTNSNPDVRRQAIDHALECTEIMRATGSSILSLWFADGTNYAGQDSFRGRKRFMAQAFEEVYTALPEGGRMLIEYKFFEPPFYHTDLSDWGIAATFARQLGPQAQVLVDTGHHALGTNVEHIVAILLDEGLLGGFHFNSRKYADDDLIVGTVNPFELFLIYNELIDAERDEDSVVSSCARNVAYMIDQSHNIEPKLEAMVQSVVNCQAAYAKALLIDRKALAERRAAQDVLGAYRVLTDAYETDVRPLLAEVRVEMGLAPDPFAAYAESDYPDKLARERGGGTGSGGGYPGA